MAAETVTIKVYPKSRNKLRIISAIKTERHVDTIERLLEVELKKIQKKKK